jgi:hypothetical protein
MKRSLWFAARSALVIGAVVAASAQATSAAHAESCFGDEHDAATVCVGENSGGLPTVNPTGSSKTLCIDLGNPQGGCTPVTVPIPTVQPGSGQPLTVECLSDRVAFCQ